MGCTPQLNMPQTFVYNLPMKILELRLADIFLDGAEMRCDKRIAHSIPTTKAP
jgi:hypothetical protein